MTSQTQDGMSFADVSFFVQVEGASDYIDASGHITSVEVGGYERQIGEAYTGNGDKALLVAGKTSPAEITAKTVYTENPGEVFKTVWDAKEQKKRVRVKWMPKGNNPGNWVYTSDWGYIQSCPPPQGEAGSSDVVLSEMVFKSPSVTQDVVS